MANQEKDTETLPECSTEDTPVKSETTSSPLGEEASAAGDTLSESCSAGLLSMPCLLKDLRPQNTGGSTRPRAHDESDSSPCLLSPSSSGHLGDSDTQSSAEEGKRALGTGAVVAGDTAATGRKSRRSHSESDTPNATMAAKKNRCQERQANGRVRVRGHRSRLQKERMRMRRQKREAAARRKPDLLQDSSTSDSDITAQSSSSSSSSSSSDNEHGAGINSHTPARRRRRTEYSRAASHGRSLLAEGGATSSGLGGVLEEALTRFAVMQRQTEEHFRVWMDRLARLHSDSDQSESEQGGGRGRQSSFLPSSESQETLAAWRMAQLSASVNATFPTQNATCSGAPDSVDPNLLNV
ncbi:uncharacterized protein C18orf25 homolog isoform X1 [Clupea harengus]|uniref:Uncharacterized protein C18orf25 homolog isoform X1 n=1 Tax=Clupea harengus TaxID=7950 RepID=A0A6P8GEZ9_CLUHA|nr:uncharacterized protein C18orf25 homolog isoform X1 [Clupea harengus]